VPTLASNFSGDDEFGPYGERLELIELGRPEFFQDGLCREYNDRVNFFPALGESSAPAKRVCSMRLVRRECLNWAEAQPDRYGIWGGRLFLGRRDAPVPREAGPAVTARGSGAVRRGHRAERSGPGAPSPLRIRQPRRSPRQRRR
jgi:hypothetical protein